MGLGLTGFRIPFDQPVGVVEKLYGIAIVT